MWWNDALIRKEDAWKQVLGARDEAAKLRRMEAYREDKRKDKEVYTYITAKKEVNERFVGR